VKEKKGEARRKKEKEEEEERIRKEKKKEERRTRGKGEKGRTKGITRIPTQLPGIGFDGRRNFLAPRGELRDGYSCAREREAGHRQRGPTAQIVGEDALLASLCS
jgi:hypothetical protein